MNLDKKFTLGEKLSQEQIDFFNRNGFLHFQHVFSQEQVHQMLSEIARIEEDWIKNDYEKINGIPIKYGKDENGKRIVQRFAFASLHSDYLHNILQDPRIQNLRYLIGEEARITENER